MSAIDVSFHDARLPCVDYCRRRAQQLHQMAAHIADGPTRERMLEAAEYFIDLADHWQREMQDAPAVAEAV